MRIDPVSLEPRLKVIGVEVWSDDPAFAAEVARTGVTGICGSGIIDVVAEMYLAGVIDADGVVQGELAASSPRVVADGRTFAYVLWGDPDDASARIAITQNDVRAIQLAKAALRAGIDLLVEHAGDPPLTDIRLAGAFGAHIDPLHALVLGLVPDCPLDGVRAVGNAAGTGAVQALLSRQLRCEMERAVRRRREDRDRHRAQVPGAVRGGDGIPACNGAVRPSRSARGPAGAPRTIRSIRCRWAWPPPAQTGDKPMSDEQRSRRGRWA